MSNTIDCNCGATDFSSHRWNCPYVSSGRRMLDLAGAYAVSSLADDRHTTAEQLRKSTITDERLREVANRVFDCRVYKQSVGFAITELDGPKAIAILRDLLKEAGF